MVWLKWILIVVVSVLALIFAVGLMLPDTYHVERSVEISAPVPAVRALVNDLRAWESWTPWKDEDPTIEVTFGSATTGVGASQTWTGDSGNGELSFTRCDDGGVGYDLSFEAGKYQSVGAILYEAVDGGTRVTWSMDGENDGVVAKWFGVMMDRMVGPMFENGLSKLKTVAENAA